MPKITGVAPNTGVAGTPIKIQGEGFGAARGSSLLEIGGKNVNHVTWGDKEISTAIPEGVSDTPHIRIVSLSGGPSENWQFNPPKKAAEPVKPVVPPPAAKPTEVKPVEPVTEPVKTA